MADARLPSMSQTESLVMDLLRGSERYGLELVEASGGALKRGSVYVTLARMEEKGFIESRQEEREQRPARHGEHERHTSDDEVPSRSWCGSRH